MSALGRFFGGIRSLLRRDREEQELTQELDAYVDAAIERKTAAGMSREKAEREARVELGSVESVKDEVRDAGWESLVETFFRDARHALRFLRKSPAFAVTAILTLGLGIGATTTIFTVVNAVLLQPLPYRNPEQIVRIIENFPAEESMMGVPTRRTSMNEDAVQPWREQMKSLSHIGVTMLEARTMLTAEGTVRLEGARVSPALFPIRGIEPILGRGLSSAEEGPDALVVVLGVDTWRRYFASDPNVINRTLVLDGQAHTIIGVMPEEFGSEAFWTPYFIAPPQPGMIRFINVVARLQDGVTVETAVAEANVVGHQLRGSTPEPGAPPRFEIARVQDEMVAPVRPALQVLVVAVGIMLLIVCANVANLLLARVARRQREIAIRRSVGATPGRIVRQILTESMVLGIAGGLAGIGFAYLGVRVLKAVAVINMPPNGMIQVPAANTILPRLDEVSVNPGVLFFALAVSLVAGVFFGMAPAIGSRQPSTSRVSQRTRPGYLLAVAQLALATTLLVGAGLLLHSFLNLTSINLGFDSNDVLRFGVVIPQEYTADQKLDVMDRIAADIRRMPSVEAVGYTDAPPFSSGSSPGNGVYEPPRIEADRELRSEQAPEYRMVSAGYLRAMGVRLLQGRWLEEEDRGVRPPGVLISESYARYYFGDKNPLGTVFNARSGVVTPMVVAGIVEDVHLRSVEGTKPTALFIDPIHSLITAKEGFAARGRPLTSGYSREFLTRAGGTVAFAARVNNGDPMSIASQLPALVRQIDPTAAVEGVMPMDDLLWGATARPRFYAVVIGFFGSIAGFLAAIGIYGVLSYGVTQRTQEFGIRMALGAKRRDVLGLVLRQGVMMAAVGIPVGIAGAFALTRYLEAMLFGITSLDVQTYIAVVIVFAATALLAAYIPARRATRVDPLIALRYE